MRPSSRFHCENSQLTGYSRYEITHSYISLLRSGDRDNPTIKHLEQLSSFGSADELLAFATGREVVPVEPRVVMGGEHARILLPGEPGYEQA